MNDDWDGVDWAEQFSGPDDDEIERLREQEWHDGLENGTPDSRQTFIFHRDTPKAEVADSGYRYPSFEVASNRARDRSSHLNKYRVEAVAGGWVLKSTPVSDLDRLVEEYCDTESKFSIGIALFHALANGQEEYAYQLLERPVEVNVVGHSGASSLMVAAQRGYAGLCSKLLNLGAIFQTEIEIPLQSGPTDSRERADTVMQRALQSQDWPTIEVITKVYISAEWSWMKENIATSDTPYWGYPRLVEAARYGMSALCAEMIGHGVPTGRESLSISDTAPIEAAFSNDQVSTCIVLAAMGADVQPLRAMEGWTDELEATFYTINKYWVSTKVTS